MASEQDINGYTKSSDVYSVGIAALELATGEAPYAGLPVTQVCVVNTNQNYIYDELLHR